MAQKIPGWKCFTSAIQEEQLLHVVSGVRNMHSKSASASLSDQV